MDNPYDDSSFFPAFTGVIPTDRNMSVLNMGSFGMGLASIGNSTASPGPAPIPTTNNITEDRKRWFDE